MLYGSHNSCTYGAPQNCICLITMPWVQNQSLTITEQLKKGVRWFDLRLSYSNDIVYLSHTIILSHTLKSIFQEFADFFLQHLDYPPIIIQLRVDFHDRSHTSLIQTCIPILLTTYHPFLLPTNIAAADLFSSDRSLRTEKWFLYCSDDTVNHPQIAVGQLMPIISMWERPSIQACRDVMDRLEDAFHLDLTHSYLYPDEKMLIFDYSSYLPLCITDRQQMELLQHYDDCIKKANLTILAGNHIERFFYF